MSFGGRIALAAVSVWTQTMWQSQAAVLSHGEHQTEVSINKEMLPRAAPDQVCGPWLQVFLTSLLSDNHYKATM